MAFSVVITGPISSPKLATQPSATCKCLFFKSDSNPASNSKPTFCCLTGFKNTSPEAKRFKLYPSTYWIQLSGQYKDPPFITLG